MLTEVHCRKAKATDAPLKLSDGGGLRLFVTPAGGKTWQYRYEFGGKENILTIGPYPAVGLAEARAARDEAKADKRAGRDPSVAKRVRVASVAAEDAVTFEALAREWFNLNKSRWTPVHASDTIHSLERDVFPEIGSLPVREITAPIVLTVLRKIEARPAIETARRVRQRMSAVFVYGISKATCDDDPAGIVKGALAPLVKGRQPAITDLMEARAMLAKAEAEPAHAVTKLALRFLALCAVRPGVIAGTPWSELNAIGDNSVWTVPAARMKLKKDKKRDATYDHLVPLSVQALEVIAALRTITGDGPLAFPNTRHVHKPMSENAMGYLLNRAGYHQRHVPHGWRATFSTIMNEKYKADHAVIELMLAHVPENEVASAYNRAQHLARRKELAQIWADLILEGAKPAASLLEGPHRR